MLLSVVIGGLSSMSCTGESTPLGETARPINLDAPVSYRIALGIGQNGTVNPSGSSAYVDVPQGGSQTFTFTPDPGFVVSGLSVDGANVPPASSYTFTDVQSPHFLYVYFDTSLVDITTYAFAGGSISPSGVLAPDNNGNIKGILSVPRFGDQTFTVTPNRLFAIASVRLYNGDYAHSNQGPCTKNGAVWSCTLTHASSTNSISATFVALGPVLLSGAPWGSTRETTLSITVSGASIQAYKYKLGPSSTLDCSDDSTQPYGAWADIASPITDSIASLPDGPMGVCVIGRNAAGHELGLNSAATATWTKRSAATPELARLEASTGVTWAATFDSTGRTPTYLAPQGAGPVFLAPGADPQVAAERFLAENATLFGIAPPASELVRDTVTKDKVGMTHVIYSQKSGGLPVFGARLGIHFNHGGRIAFVSGQLVPNLESMDLNPTLSADEARRLALVEMRKSTPSVPGESVAASSPQLGIEVVDGSPRLAYRVGVTKSLLMGGEALAAPGLALTIDAKTGAVLAAESNLRTIEASGKGRADARAPRVSTQRFASQRFAR